MKIEQNDITVIVPMYNSSQTIIRTLDSICQQTQRQFIQKVVVIDDGSVDDSYLIVKQYVMQSPVKIELIKKENGGVSSARNKGIEVTSTKWIAFCDSDDIWLPNKIEKQIEAVEKYDADLIGCNHQKKDLRILFKTINEDHKATLKELCIKMFPQTSTILVKKSICEEFGGFDESQRYAEDGNLFMKIAYKYNYYYMPEQLVVFDNGRRGFGVSGLSSNLKGMHDGNMKNISDLENMGYISKPFGILIRLYYYMKYIRRILIVKVAKQ